MSLELLAGLEVTGHSRKSDSSVVCVPLVERSNASPAASDDELSHGPPPTRSTRRGTASAKSGRLVHDDPGADDDAELLRAAESTARCADDGTRAAAGSASVPSSFIHSLRQHAEIQTATLARKRDVAAKWRSQRRARRRHLAAARDVARVPPEPRAPSIPRPRPRAPAAAPVVADLDAFEPGPAPVERGEPVDDGGELVAPPLSRKPPFPARSAVIAAAVARLGSTDASPRDRARPLAETCAALEERAAALAGAVERAAARRGGGGERGRAADGAAATSECRATLSALRDLVTAPLCSRACAARRSFRASWRAMPSR